MKVFVDREACQGYGNCVLADGATFDLDDDGIVVLVRSEVAAGDEDSIRRAAYDCPTSSITLTSE